MNHPRALAPRGAPAPVTILLAAAWLMLAAPVRAQTLEDGIMMAKRNLFVGDLYTHETWDEYWEGSLKRDNGNIGTLTTRTNLWFANYGLTDRLNVMAMVPHVWTRPSQGVLRGMEGFQDLTLSAKYSILDRPSTRAGAVRVMAVAAAGLPLTDYTPDYYPMSLGSGSRRLSGRFTLHVQPASGWYATGSTAYTWRAGVTLDRPYYYTDGRLFLTDEVDMPNVFDYVASAGYMKGGLMTAVSLSQQRTLGGGDIRRQDMPFVSNRMNFSKAGAMVMAPVPKLQKLAFQLAYAYTLNGRNVGQATSITAGLLYRLPIGAETVR